MAKVPRLRSRLRAVPPALLALLSALTLTVAMAASASSAPVLPTPKSFVSQLDLQCFRSSPYTPPSAVVSTRHLNPVLAGLPEERVTLGNRDQVCVPVAKNGVAPSPDALDFIRFVDLACYRITGVTVNRQLDLAHLNPVLSGVPASNVVMTTPQQLCVPVVKNGNVPPPEILRLVQYIDLKCYAISPQTAMNRQLSLRHLNPVLAGVPGTSANVTLNRQLCVPVQKNAQPVPADVLAIVRWIDLVKYDLSATAGVPISLSLRHINPLLAGLPPEQATLTAPSQLAVPVAKNNAFPPG
ncbi:hypothetical protein ACFVH6_06660 [Spirillospora sp. NPDC127200]